jgi:integrase/recombinase XerC
VVGKGIKVRSIPISNTLLVEIQDWLLSRAKMAETKPYVEDSPFSDF